MKLHTLTERLLLYLLIIVPASTAGQTFLPSMSGAGDLDPMADLQQPDAQIAAGFGLPLLPTPSWPNYCAPTSAANVWHFYDLRDGLHLSPWSGDLPQPGPPFGWGMSWSTATIQGQGVLPPVPLVHMNTNNVLGLVPTWTGTRIVDSYFGVQSFCWSVESAGGHTKAIYIAPAAIDEVAAYVPDDPGGIVNITTEAAAFAAYMASVDADTPVLLSFRSWVAQPPLQSSGGVEYYAFAKSQSYGTPYPQLMEEWGDLSGHMVTGVGYRLAYDPGGQGPRNWYIVRDNWSTTGIDVAVPVDGEWKATIYITPPVSPEDDWGFRSEQLLEVDFAVDRDFGPTGLFSSGVYQEELLGGDAEDDFYLTPFPPGNTNLKTMD